MSRLFPFNKESKISSRKTLTDFCLHLIDLNPVTQQRTAETEAEKRVEGIGLPFTSLILAQKDILGVPFIHTVRA